MSNITTNKNDLTTAIRQYHEDGATVLRNVISPIWLERLGNTIDTMLADQNAGMDYSRPGEGRFFGDLFAWLRQPVFEDFVRNAGLAELAARVMQSAEVRFFYDQLLVKEPGTAKRTPWHQDLPYWPVSGEQVLSIWVPIDVASPDNGVVTYVKGSHRWAAFHPMENWSDNEALPDALAAPLPDQVDAQRGETPGPSIADVEAHPENYQLLAWTLEPGDVLLHHPRTVHGARGNLSVNRRRRALATRWLGDDARWDDSRPHFMRLFRDVPDFPYPPLQTGEPMAAPLFPRLWPRA